MNLATKKEKVDYRKLNIELFARYQAARTNRQKRRIETEIIKLNERLIHNNSHRWIKNQQSFSFEDLTAYGLEAMLTAIRHFDPTKGVQFSTFAHSHLNGRILRAIRDHGSLIRVPQKVQAEEKVSLFFVPIDAEDMPLQVEGSYASFEQNFVIEQMLYIANNVNDSKKSLRQCFVDCSNKLIEAGLLEGRKNINSHHVVDDMEIVQTSLF